MILKGGETMKVIRAGEKDFEEEKAKMFKSEVSKEEQLRRVFNRLLTALLVEYDMIQYGGMSEKELKDKYTNIFMKEVTIRTKLQEAVMFDISMKKWKKLMGYNTLIYKIKRLFWSIIKPYRKGKLQEVIT